jgi:thiamine-phosphate pyrophosphorylase
VSRSEVPRPGRVYVLADAGRIPPDRLPEAAAEMAAAGIETLQLRAKSLPDEALWRLAEAVCDRLAGWRGTLWIDDRVDLAMALPFAGVHLGQADLPPAEARRLLPPRVLVGRSTHDRAQLEAADADPAADWLALGPIFPTASKAAPDPVVGLERLAELRRATAKPLVAIGGIDAGNLARVLDAGADSAAVLSAACDGDVAANCRRLVAAARSAA